MLGAGTDTSAAALTWACYYISTHAGVLRDLKREINDVLGSRPPALADLPNMPYTKSVIEESLRIRPPFWGFARKAIAEDVIGGFTIPAGSTVLISPYVTHRHPKFWPNPEAFDPNRFEPERVAAMHPYAHVPFGAGPRKCIGWAFAMMEMQLLLPMLIQAMDLYLVPGAEVTAMPSLVLSVRGGLWMTAHPRS